jgi:choline/glycine/proline betaine transport protein
LFWSISEPFIIFLMAEGGTAEAAKEAMKFTFYIGVFMPGQCMHW